MLAVGVALAWSEVQLYLHSGMVTNTWFVLCGEQGLY